VRSHITCVAAVIALAFGGSAFAAVNFAVDIDSTRLSSSDTSGTLATQAGFTSWDLTNVATGGNLLVLDGVTFEIFGLAAANQSRVRTAGGGGGPYDALLADFVYNESAAGRAVGLRITGLPVGTYSMQSWHYDASTLTSENFIQIEVRNQGGSATILVDNRPFSTEAASFSFDVTEAGQVKEIIFREDDAATATDPTDSNRARLNGFTLVPEPASLTLLLLAASLSRRRRMK
jgi:hypothetical protein